MSHGYWPITVLNQDSEQFHEHLRDFYESGEANAMMEFFETTCENSIQGKE